MSACVRLCGSYDALSSRSSGVKDIKSFLYISALAAMPPSVPVREIVEARERAKKEEEEEEEEEQGREGGGAPVLMQCAGGGGWGRAVG